MTDIATISQPRPQAATSSSASSSMDPSVISSPPSDMKQSGDIPATSAPTSSSSADPETGQSSAPPEPSETTQPVENSNAPPKPAFSWGKPINVVAKDTAPNGSISSSSTTTTTTTTTTTAAKAKSLLSIMQEEQEISKSQQAQKEEDDFMKQAIQQSLAMQQQEEDDLALALRLSQLDAGITDMPTAMAMNGGGGGGGTKSTPPATSGDRKQAPVSAEAKVPETSTLAATTATTATATTATTATTSDSTSAASIPAAATAAASSGDGGGGGGGLSEDELASIQLAIQQAEDEDMQKSLQLAMQLELENESLLRTKQQQQQQRSGGGSSSIQNQGNVRVISREEYLLEQKGLLLKKDHGDVDEEYYYQHHQANNTGAGFRINAQHASSNPNWTRLDGFVVGPNDEIRTKHDPELQGQANAHRLHLDDEYDHYEVNGGGGGGGKSKGLRVGNKAYNSFQQTMKKKTVKGVASHGQGRANTDTEKTKEGALDSRVRLLIGKTINQDWIDEFHGCVKEGKEALVYHATSGTTADEEMGIGQMDDLFGTTTKVGDVETGKYDVAVKVFKRIQEFRNRGQYVQGDPRYHSQDFSHSSGRAQLELWAEKEYRNLIRAYRVGIPVPQPLLQRENVLFLRFLGQDGWPCPQLREVKLKRKSHKWMALYQQTMEAIQTLYQQARLVHGDLSEYNLLVCPSHLLLRKKNPESSTTIEEESSSAAAAKKKKKDESNDGKIADPTEEEEEVEEQEEEEEVTVDDDQKMPASLEDDSKPAPEDGKQKAVEFASKDTIKEDSSSFSYDPNALQIALIDFGQAVDIRHPQAEELLERDLLRVKQFFVKMGIANTLSKEAAMAYVTTEGAPLLI